MPPRSRRAWAAMAFAIVLHAIVAAMAPRAHADSPSPAQVRAARELARTGDWDVRWDEETGSPAWIAEEQLSVDAAYRRPRPFAAESLALSFFRRHAALFPLRWGHDSLVVVQRSSSSTARGRRRGRITTVRTEQLYMGLPVENGGYTVSMSPDGKVLTVGGRFYGGIELAPRPTIDAEEGARVAWHEIGAGVDSVLRPIRLEVTRRDGQDHLVWAATVFEDPLHVWIVQVDAHDGQVIRRVNRVLIDPR